MNKWKIILPAAAFLLLAGQAVAQSVEEEERLRELEAREQEIEERLRAAEERMAEAAREIAEITKERLPRMADFGRILAAVDHQPKERHAGPAAAALAMGKDAAALGQKRQGMARGLARGAHQRLDQFLHRAAVGGVRGIAAIAPFKDRGQQIGKQGHSDDPITRSGSQVAIPGNRHSNMIPRTMQAT